MNKLLLLAAAIPASVLAFTVACDGGSGVACTTDDDCQEGEICAPVSDVDASLICQVDNSECAAAVDCQIAYNQDGGAQSNTECTADSGCGADEICAKGFNDQGFCVAADDGSTACTDVGGEVVSVTKVEGGSADACLDPASSTTCDDTNTCTFN